MSEDTFGWFKFLLAHLPGRQVDDHREPMQCGSSPPSALTAGMESRLIKDRGLKCLFIWITKYLTPPVKCAVTINKLKFQLLWASLPLMAHLFSALAVRHVKVLWPLSLVYNLYFTVGKVAFPVTFHGLGFGPDINESVGCAAVLRVTWPALTQLRNLRYFRKG